jgi:hypothetical protein
LVVVEVTLRLTVSQSVSQSVSQRVLVEVEVTLRLTVSQSVCLGFEHPCGACGQILLPVGVLLSEICGLVSMGRPLLKTNHSIFGPRKNPQTKFSVLHYETVGDSYRSPRTARTKPKSLQPARQTTRLREIQNAYKILLSKSLGKRVWKTDK